VNADGTTLTPSGGITVAAGQAGFNIITFHPTAPIVDVLITCTGLPSGASFSISPYPNPIPGPISEGFALIFDVSTSPSTPPETYPLSVGATYSFQQVEISPTFAISPLSLNALNVANPLQHNSLPQQGTDPIAIPANSI
jgi:hypothetical protein